MIAKSSGWITNNKSRDSSYINKQDKDYACKATYNHVIKIPREDGPGKNISDFWTGLKSTFEAAKHQGITEMRPTEIRGRTQP